MCTGGASGLPAVEDLPVNETDMRWLELEARFGFCEKRNSLNFLRFFSHERNCHKDDKDQKLSKWLLTTISVVVGV